MFSIFRRSTAFLAAVAILSGLCSARNAVAEDNCIIKGKVSYTGTPKKRTKLNVSADSFCVQHHAGGRGVGTEDVIANKKSKTLRNVVVSVKKGLGDRKFDAPAEPMTIDQQGCQYKPHIITMMKGQKLVVRNSDDTLHNIHLLAKKNPEKNFGQPKKGMTKELEFSQVEKIHVKCDVHAWMGAYIAVFPHPFFDTTDKKRKGAFELDNLPPGEYVIEAWHEVYGTLTQKVTVADGETKEIEFVYEIK